MANNNSQIKPKFCFPTLKKHLEDNGRTFSDFLDKAGRPPSRRTWSDGVNRGRGVTRGTAIKMQKSIISVHKEWGISCPERIYTFISV